MINCKTKKWGNSLGIVIPKEEVQHLELKEDQQIVVEIIKTEHPLKELFGAAKNNKITKEEFLETRKLMESKWV
jgi:antitoxin component of MazEF toxin-antitoxin module